MDPDTATPAPRRRDASMAGDPTALGASWGGVVVVGGEDALAFAEAAQAGGGPPLASGIARLAVLATEPPAGAGDGSNPRATGLPDGCADTVVLRHAWDGPAQLADAAAEARRLLRPAGRVVLADWDLERVLASSPRTYPDAFFYAALPAVAAALEASLAFGLDLPLALGRARFTGIATGDVDEEVATFASPDRYLAWLRERGFRGMHHAEPAGLDAVDGALADLVRQVAPRGEVTHREPWRVAVGVRPG